MKFIADSDIWGKVQPPPGVSNTMASDPVAGAGKLLGTLVNLFIIGSSMFVLLYMLWGAFDWITSGGDKEKVQHARNKISYAAIGMILIFVVLVVFGVLTGQILGIIENVPGEGWSIKIPHL
jgi:hypothetical protein